MRSEPRTRRDKAPPKDSPRTVSYLRVSTIDQDTDKFKNDVLVFANQRGFTHVEFESEKVSGRKQWKSRKISEIIKALASGDRIVVPELSRLGRNTLETLEILRAAKDKDIAIFSVKEGLQLNGDDIMSKVMSTVLALVADLERDFISLRTREALAARKASGVKLGRPKGPGKSKLDKYREEIVALLKNGSPKSFVAQRYKTTQANLWNWLKKNNIDAQPQVERPSEK